MNRPAHSRNYFNRPAVITGLCFFLTSSVLAGGAGHFNLFDPLPAGKLIASSDLPESTQVHLRAGFAPLYSEKDRETRGDSEHVSLRTHGWSGEFFSGRGRCSYYLSGSNEAMEATYRKKTDDYYLVTHRREWNFATGAAYQFRNLLVGAGLGRHWPEAMEREHLRDIRDEPENYLRCGPWLFSFDAKMDFAKAAAWLSLFSGPVYSSVSELVTSDESGLRSFPLSLIRHGVGVGFDIRSGMLYTATEFGIDYFENADLQTVRNSMPSDVAVRGYRLEHRGTARVPFADSLFWDLSGAVAGGWAATYNFDRDRFTFLKCEEVRIKNVQAKLGSKLPGSIIAGVSQASLHAASPTGFLRLSAMSEWSVFQPFDYRYTGAEVTYHEAGAFINRKCMLSRFDFVPQLEVSHIKACARLISTHKEIVVLVPVYVDTIKQEILDTRLMLFEPSLTVLARFGSIHITGSVHQMLPVFITDNAKPDVPAEPEQPGQQSTSDNIVTGGTRLQLAAIWRIPRQGK